MLFSSSCQQLLPGVRSSLCLEYLFVLYHLFVIIISYWNLIFLALIFSVTTRLLLFCCFFSSLQELLPGARSNVSVLNWILHRFSVTQRTMDSICSTILKIVTARCLEKGTRLINNFYVHIWLKMDCCYSSSVCVFSLFLGVLVSLPTTSPRQDHIPRQLPTAKIQIIMILSLSLPFFLLKSVDNFHNIDQISLKGIALMML